MYKSEEKNNKGARGNSRVGKMWSGRERESRVCFVPDRDSPTSVSVPTVYRPDLWHLVSVPTVSRPAVSVFTAFSVPLSAQLFPSHPNVRTQFLPSPNPFKWQMFPSHLPCVVYFPLYVYVYLSFFWGTPPMCLHLYPKHQMGWAQFDRWGHVAIGLGMIRAVCRAWQTL